MEPSAREPVITKVDLRWMTLKILLIEMWMKMDKCHLKCPSTIVAENG